MPRSSARSTVSSWKGTMSTTGWRVGTSVDVAAERLERRDRLGRARRRAPLALEHEAADGLVDRGEMAVQELLEPVRLGCDVDALAQLQRRLLRGRPVAAGAGDQEALVLGDRQALAREHAGDRVGEPARRPRRAAPRARRRRRCRTPCGSSSPRARASRRRPRRRARRAGSSAFPVTSQLGPAKAPRPRASAASRPRG